MLEINFRSVVLTSGPFELFFSPQAQFPQGLIGFMQVTEETVLTFEGFRMVFACLCIILKSSLAFRVLLQRVICLISFLRHPITLPSFTLLGRETKRRNMISRHDLIFDGGARHTNNGLPSLPAQEYRSFVHG